MNVAFKRASEASLKGILLYCNVPLVSKDFVGSNYSCILDAELTRVIAGRLVKILGWYDNEWAYSLRIVELVEYIAKKGL